MSKVEKGGGGPIDPPSRLRITIFSSRLLGLSDILSLFEYKLTQHSTKCIISSLIILCLKIVVG